MRTVIAFSAEKVGFVAGLKWVPLADYSGNKVTSDVRSKAGLAMAERIILHSANTGNAIQTALGMYAPNEFEKTSATVLHSLGAACVYAYPEHLHLILAWRLDEKKVAVIVVQNGLPIADEIKTELEAVQLMKSALSGKMGQTGHVIYTNDPKAFLGGTLATTEGFFKVASKSTKLTSIPVRKAYIVGALSALALIAAGSAFAYQNHIKNERAKLAAQIAAEDPLPAYQALLAINIGRLGFDRAALLNVIAGFNDVKVWEGGWLLSQIECSVDQCVYTWQRDGGTTANLRAANPGAEVMAGSKSETVMLRRAVKLPLSGLRGLQDAVSQTAVTNDYVNTYQLWRNAKLGVEETEDLNDFKTWPTPVGGAADRLPKALTLKARKIAVTVPLPLAQEVVMSTPAAVWWSSLVLKYSPTEAQKLLTVTFTGNTYVQ